MSQDTSIPLLDHELAEDELAWMKAVYENFGEIRASFVGRENEFNPKEALRAVLGREEFKFISQVELSGPGRGGWARTAMAAGLPRFSCPGWSCTDTPEAGPISSRCMWLVRPSHSRSMKMASRC